jgi:septal ring factor EnvC (AmiA/AmiB activator)
MSNRVVRGKNKGLYIVTVGLCAAGIATFASLAHAEDFGAFLGRRFGEMDSGFSSLNSRSAAIEARLDQLTSDNQQLRSNLKASLDRIDALTARIQEMEGQRKSASGGEL